MLSFQRAATETDRRGRHFDAPTELPKRVHGELSPETVASLRASGKTALCFGTGSDLSERMQC